MQTNQPSAHKVRNMKSQQYSLEDMKIAYSVISERKPEPQEDDDTRIVNVLNARSRVSPRYITDLKPNEVFVFGSNDKGMHLGRASKQALDWGAVMGVAEGHKGRTYAIPTTHLISSFLADKSEEELMMIGKEILSATIKESEDHKRFSYFIDGKKICGISRDEYVPYTRDVKQTTGNQGQLSDYEKLKKSIDEFIQYARKDKGHRFLVTRIGCGYSSFSDKDIAPLFKSALELPNVYLPQSFLDVLFGNKPITSPMDLVPAQSAGVKSFVHELDSRLYQYQNWLITQLKAPHDGEGGLYAKMYGDKQYMRRNLVDTVEKISNGIVRAVELYLGGSPAKAYKSMEDAVMNVFAKSMEKEAAKGRNDKSLLLEFLSSVSDSTFPFFRMRYVQDNWERRKVNCRGMFHVPLSMRGLVKTQRYSIAGYPCLYLGKSIFGCWEELGRPNLNSCLISKVDSKKGFHVLDLSIPAAEDWDAPKKEKEDALKCLILRFPLIIACTFRAHSNADTFKPEYIVPQLLLQWVKEKASELNKDIEKPEDKQVFGIKYTSVNWPGDRPVVSDDSGFRGVFGFPKETYNNYVIPVDDVKDEYCSVLCDRFSISAPICEEHERIKHPDTPSSDQPDPSKSYESSLFGQLESTLKTATMYNLTSAGEYQESNVK